MKENRLFKELYFILERGKVRAIDLSEKFEVSLRTIYRDIDVLSSAGIPIYATKGRDGGIQISDGFVLRKTLLSKKEQEQLLLALSQLERAGIDDDKELQRKLSGLFKIKQTNWIEVDFSNWHRGNSYEELFNNLKDAILNKKIIKFRYFSSNEKETNRVVKPVRIIFKGWDWYLYGYSMEREGFRYFKISRIKSLDITTDSYNDDFDHVIIKNEIENENTIVVKIKFNRKVAYRVYDEIVSEIKEDEDGNLYASIELPYDSNLYNYIFSFGDGAEVLEPTDVKDEIIKRIKEMKDTYLI